MIFFNPGSGFIRLPGQPFSFAKNNFVDIVHGHFSERSLLKDFSRDETESFVREIASQGLFS
jgi:hypothetical protein